MKGFGIDWDEDTYRFLLQAFVNVDQIHAAYSLLKGAEEQDMFVVSPEHYAIVMAGAARCGQHALVDSLHFRMKKSNMHVSFAALVAVVESAAQQKPGVRRTLNLANEFVEHFRQSLAASQNAPGHTLANKSDAAAIQRSNFHGVGRAIALLVQLRQLGTAEELMTVFNEMFPEYQEAGQYPANVVSALMTAHYKDGDLDRTLELWQNAWEDTLERSKKKSGAGVYAGTEYDLSRAINIALKAFRDKNDAKGLSDCIDNLTKEGFKLTNASWSLAVRYLSELGRWERAMFWCETMLMPGWQGWSWGRTSKDKAFFRNTRALRAPKNIVFRLQQEWLRLRTIAAWDGDISRQLHHVQDKFPRLYQAFTTADIQTLQMTHQVDTGRKPVRDLDKVLRSMPYDELMKAKEALLKQLLRERQREKRLGIETSTSTDPEERQQRKQKLQSRIRRYALTWAERREQQFAEKRGDSSSVSGVDPDQVVAKERISYWNSFFDRYDQRPHGGYGPKFRAKPPIPHTNKYRGPPRRSTNNNKPNNDV
jgi:pentatricopeptide repeat-containing protein PET309